MYNAVDIIIEHITKNPSDNILYATYSMDAATIIANEIRSKLSNVIEDQNEQRTVIRTIQNNILKFIGVGAAIAGYGTNLFIIDKPLYKNDSNMFSQKFLNWFWESCYCRLLPEGKFVFIDYDFWWVSKEVIINGQSYSIENELINNRNEVILMKAING